MQLFRNAFSGRARKKTLSFVIPQELNATGMLDIATETCPMTFVRTRLALDRMSTGQTLLVRLRGDEPRRNIPQTATEQGHAVLAERDMPDGTSLILLRKG